MGKVYGKRTNKSGTNFKIPGIHEIQLSSGSANGSIVNGVRKPFLFSLEFDKTQILRILKTPKSKHFQKNLKPLIIEIRFFLQNDVFKRVIFNGETIVFTVSLMKLEL